MKALLFILALTSILALNSCRGKSNAGADASKLCNCMEATKQDPSKAEECATMAKEMEDSYEDDSAGLVQFAKSLSECMDSNAQ